MGRAIDLFVTYRFLRLLTTPFKDTDAYKLGIIDEKGNRIMLPKPKTGVKILKPQVELVTSEQKNSYTILHKLVFNIKKLFAKVPGLRTKVGTYANIFLILNTNLWRMVYEFFNSLVESSTAGFVDFGNLIRLPFSSMIPNLNASVSSKGVVNNLRNLYVTNKSIALPIRVPSITLELPHLFQYDRVHLL